MELRANLVGNLQWQAYGQKGARSAQHAETLQKSASLLERAQQRFGHAPPVSASAAAWRLACCLIGHACP